MNMALVNGGCLHCTNNRNSCKFFSESDKKKVMVTSKIQVSDPGPSWPSCLINARYMNEWHQVVFHLVNVYSSLNFKVTGVFIECDLAANNGQCSSHNRSGNHLDTDDV